MNASEAEFAECQSGQSWIVQEAADQPVTVGFTILGTGSVDNIEFHSVLDIAQDEILLTVSHIDPKGSKAHKIFQGLGYSQNTLMQKFHVAAHKIERSFAHINIC